MNKYEIHKVLVSVSLISITLFAITFKLTDKFEFIHKETNQNITNNTYYTVREPSLNEESENQDSNGNNQDEVSANNSASNETESVPEKSNSLETGSNINFFIGDIHAEGNVTITVGSVVQ